MAKAIVSVAGEGKNVKWRKNNCFFSSRYLFFPSPETETPAALASLSLILDLPGYCTKV